MGCADTGATTDHRFDLMLESWRAQCALLLHVGADLRQAVIAQRVPERCPVGNAALLLVRTKTQILGVGNHHAVGHGLCIGDRAASQSGSEPVPIEGLGPG